MKLATNLLALGSVLAIASTAIANGVNTPTNQYFVGSVTNSGATSGNYTVIGAQGPTSGTLSNLNIAGTVTTQQEPVEKTTGSQGNQTVTSVSKAVASRITNATILELAGITTRGATLGVFTTNATTSAVAVVKSGSTTTLIDIDDFLQFSDVSDGVTINSNTKTISKNNQLVSSSEISSEIYATTITIGAPITQGSGDIELNGVTTLNRNISITSRGPKLGLTATTAFRGFAEGIDAVPTLDSYKTGPNAQPSTAFPLTLNTPFYITPAVSTSVGLGQATWTATGLPEGFTINPLTGAISGTVGTGGYFSVYNVVVTVSNYYGSDSLPLTLTLNQI